MMTTWYQETNLLTILLKNPESKLNARIQKGGEGAGVRFPPNLEKHKAVNFRYELVWIPLKSTRLPNQHSMLGHHWPANETSFKWRFVDVAMMARIKLYTAFLMNTDCQSWAALAKLVGSALQFQLG